MHADAAAANRSWAAAAEGGRQRFLQSLATPEASQTERLLTCLRSNAHTDYGRRYEFSSIRDVQTFQARVPIVRYEDLASEIDRIAAGEDGVLTASPVTRLVPTGGSTGGAKLLPFTADVSAEIAVAVDAWIADLYLRHPRVLDGRAYWSITPPAAFPVPPKTVRPIGFGDDGEYLGADRRALAARVMAVPSSVAALTDVDACRYATLLFLLRTPDLRLISVWHPSFLTGLLDLLNADFDRLVDDVANGNTLTAADRERADALRLTGASPAAIWPDLAVVSCWADAASAAPAAALAERLGGVTIQPKGLMATEGVISIPFANRHPLAVCSHFYEFIDGAGRLRLAHDLRAGDASRVLLTTGAGLYRSDLGDRIVVDGFVGATPSIRFIGRGARVSDRFGEKLTDDFATAVIAEVLRDRPRPAFAMLAPDETADGVRYALFLELEDVDAEALGDALERALRRNPHYAWCVDIGQLKPARIVQVARNSERRYIDACVAAGQRLGDVKAVALHTDGGWSTKLRGGSRRRGGL